MEREPLKVLVVDDDHDIGEVVGAILGDEGYEVTVLDQISDDAIRAAIGRLEPDCILLDGAQAVEYAESWATASDVRSRRRPIPTVMFTAHTLDAREAEQGQSQRAVAAAFTAVLPKPFHLDELLATVAGAVAQTKPFNHSLAAERGRTDELVTRLTAAGALDVRPSTQREWANFVNASGEEMQLYWWQSAGAYLVARYTADGARVTVVGHFYDLESAIRAATEAAVSD